MLAAEVSVVARPARIKSHLWKNKTCDLLTLLNLYLRGNVTTWLGDPCQPNAEIDPNNTWDPNNLGCTDP